MKIKPNSVLYVGGIHDAKGFYDLYNATKILKDYKINFYFVGINDVPGSIKNEIKTMKLNVEFVKKVPHKVLFQYYKKCDVLVHPSNYPEPFARVWNEAIHFKLPIISADNPVALEILKDNAIFYKRRDINDLSIKLKKFFKL